jgi:hypothetical protein
MPLYRNFNEQPARDRLLVTSALIRHDDPPVENLSPGFDVSGSLPLNAIRNGYAAQERFLNDRSRDMSDALKEMHIRRWRPTGLAGALLVAVALSSLDSICG